MGSPDQGQRRFGRPRAQESSEGEEFQKQIPKSVFDLKVRLWQDRDDNSDAVARKPDEPPQTPNFDFNKPITDMVMPFELSMNFTMARELSNLILDQEEYCGPAMHAFAQQLKRECNRLSAFANSMIREPLYEEELPEESDSGDPTIPRI